MSSKKEQKSVEKKTSTAVSEKPVQDSGERSATFWDRHITHMGIMAVIVIIFFSPFLFSNKMLVSSDQIGGLDWRVLYRNAVVEHGQIPMWLKSRLGGMPSIDASAGDAMYPPSLLLQAIFPIHRALGFKLVVHVLLAGIMFYLMLHKGFGASKPISLLGGIFYMLNPEFVSHVYPGHDAKMFVIAWLPFVVWRMKALTGSPSFMNASLLGLGIAASLLTSHVQMTYFMLWGLFFYWVFALTLQWKKERNPRALFPLMGWFWVAVAVGIGLSAVQLYPVYQFVREAFSVRGVDRGFEFAASWSLHWPEVFSLWVPEFGNWLEYYWSENPFKLNTEYAGAMALLLAVMAVVYKPKPWRIFWAAIGGLAVLFSLGVHTPVFSVGYYFVPMVKKMRAASMMMFWYAFSVVLLASWFLMDIARGEFSSLNDRKSAKWKKGLLITGGVFTGLALLFSMKGFVAGLMGALVDTFADPRKQSVFEANFSKNFVPMLWLWWFFALAALSALWAVINRSTGKWVFLLTVLAITLIDTYRVNRQFIQVTSPRPYFYTEPTLKGIEQEMANEPFRVYFIPGTEPKGGGGVHGLEQVGGFHDNEMTWYRAFRGDQRGTNYLQDIIATGEGGQAYLVPSNMREGNNFLDIANVRYLITANQSGYVKIRNEETLGRVSFVPNFLVMTEEEAIASLRAKEYDIRTTVALAEEPRTKPKPWIQDSLNPTPPQANIEWEQYTPNYRRATVEVEMAGFLRISEVYYPGWEIRLDGVKVPYYRADGAWMAIDIDAGRHTIEMVPNSLYLAKASAVTFPLLGFLLLYWGFVVVRSRKRRTSSSDSKS